MSNPYWMTQAPIWASRPDADGVVASYSVSGWLFMSVATLIVANVFIWSIIGLVVAVLTVIGAF